MIFIPGPPDAKLSLQASATKTATFTSDWLDLGKGFAPGGLGLAVAGVVEVTAIDVASGNETYTFKLQETVADASGAADPASVKDITMTVPASALGIVLAKGFVTGRFVRLVLTAGGTTPSITYNANLSR